ncbi:MAG: hypothetical protein J6S53_01365 [Lentisphaeria bacterium]|nr:hypothetical protein [Lentisphaeria bacterium]
MLEKIKRAVCLFCKKYRTDILYSLLLSFVVTLLYAPFLRYFFLPLWDDGNFVLHNRRLAFTWENITLYFSRSFEDLYTPMTMVSLMLDHLFIGKEPFWYHLHNLLLHIFCAVVLYCIFKRFGIRPFLAFAGCLLWALNPQKVESVIWITERKDVLSGAFAVLSFYLFMRNTEKKTLPVFSTVFAVLALLTKPSTVPLPGVMTVFLICAWGKRHTMKEYLKLLLLPLVSCGIILVVSYVITARNFPGGVERNLLIPVHNLFWYPLTSLFPQTHPIYPPLLQKWYYYWKVFLCGGLMMGIFAFWGWKVGLNWKKIAGWFLIIGGLMVPVLGMLNYTNFDYCDRYNYLVSMAVCGFFMLLCERSLRIKLQMNDMMRVGLLLICGIFFIQSYCYLPYWKNTAELFSIALNDPVPSNVKLYSTGAHSAVVSGDTRMLGEISKRAFRDWEKYQGEQGKAIYRFANFLALHCLVMENDYTSALPYYREIKKLLNRKLPLFILKFEHPYYIYLYRNMALTAAANAMREDALFFLDEFFMICDKYNKRFMGYYTAMALKAQLTNDKKLLREALENIVRLDPGLTRYASDLERLKKEEQK